MSGDGAADDMTDTETDLRDRVRVAEDDIEHERQRRRDLARELGEHVQWAESTERMMHAISHTTGRLIEAVSRDEATFQHQTMLIKKKAMRMKEYYDRLHALELHLKGKEDVWKVITSISSNGPATTVVAKSKTASQQVYDTLKAWANDTGIAREVAIFRGKENIKRARERPLVATRNALSDEFGTRTELGMRLASQAHWPEFFSPDWALSANGVVLAWSELQQDGFTMHVYINASHPIVVGQPVKITTAMTAADIECGDALYFCVFSTVPLGPLHIVRGRGAQDFGHGIGKGKGGKKGRGRSSS